MMKNLEKFVIENKCESSQFKPNEELISEAEKKLKVEFGPQLKKYLLEYGYLAYKHIELYGLNSKQGLLSDICINTENKRNIFPEIKNMVLIENQGDSDYYLVDDNDNIFRCCPEANIYENMNIKLFDYILQRFNGIAD